jgi:cAMP-dependent protein kinase regulator
MFKNLAEEEMHIVIDAMDEKTFNSGETVINEGDAGAVLYVVEAGELDCFKVLEGQSDPTFLKTYEAG